MGSRCPSTWLNVNVVPDIIVFRNQNPASNGGDSDGESGLLRVAKKKKKKKTVIMKPRQWFDLGPGVRERDRDRERGGLW